MLLKINPENPQERHIQTVVDTLKKGGVIIYPTDTVYALGCDMMNKRAIDRILKIKGLSQKNAQFSCIVEDLSTLSDYSSQVSTSIYKMMKRTLPGAYTYILKASKNVPSYFRANKKTIGIRITDHEIPHTIVQRLGNPLVSTSLKSEDEIMEYRTDPELIHENYKKMVDIVIDGGFGGLEGSTIIDCSSGNDFEIIREGKGSLDLIY